METRIDKEPDIENKLHVYQSEDEILVFVRHVTSRKFPRAKEGLICVQSYSNFTDLK